MCTCKNTETEIPEIELDSDSDEADDEADEHFSLDASTYAKQLLALAGEFVARASTGCDNNFFFRSHELNHA